MDDLKEQLRAYVDAAVNDTVTVHDVLGATSPAPSRRRRPFVGAALALAACCAGFLLIRGLPSTPRSDDRSVVAESGDDSGGAGTPDRIPDLSAPSAQRDLAVIEGLDVFGDRFVLSEDRTRGLCLTAAGRDYGCSDEGPVVPAGADPTAPRWALSHEHDDHHHEQASLLVYGYLPKAAVTVVGTYTDGRELTQGLVLDRASGLWALPMKPGENADAIEYRDAEGNAVARFCNGPCD